LNARDENLQARPEAFGALGRALAKATLFAQTNPEGAIKLIWQRYPGSGPAAGEDPVQVFKRELAALRVRLAGHAIDQASDPRWGAISGDEMSKWQEFLLETDSIVTKRDASIYFSNANVPRYNEFDPDAVRAQARAFHT
jgi:NitT/TauT family transport system substrate-binding protein